MSYADLDDEAKIALAIEFIATQQPLPLEIELFLREANLYVAITHPNAIEEESNVTNNYTYT